MANNDAYSIDAKETIVTVASWGTYVGALLLTKDPEKAETVKDAVGSLGGIVSVEQKNSISGRVSELCKSSWDVVLKNHNAIALRSELRDYNFAEDPFHWDSFKVVCERVISACKVKKLSLVKTPYKKISVDVMQMLAYMMDNDLDLNNTIRLSEISKMVETLLINQGNRQPEKTVPTGGAFALPHLIRYFGHEEELAEVLGWIEDNKIIIVYGEGGIGKTEFCREVLKRAKGPDCTVNAVNLIECRDFNQFILRVAGVLGIAVAVDDTPEIIERLVLSRLREVKGILYLDNFEDILSETKTEEAERHKVMGFLRKCIGDIPVIALISSRILPMTDFDFKELLLKPLDDDNAVSLFMEIWGGDADEVIRDFVINDLYKYPLAIILAARQKRYISSIDRLKEMWKTMRKNVKVRGMSNDRHESIETALSITYDEIKNDEKARQLWGLFTLFPEEIDVSVAESIIPDSYNAMVKLIDLSMIHRDGEKLSMLPLLREFVKESGEYADDVALLTEKVVKYYSGIFEIGRPERGSDKDLMAVESISDALYFMDCMVKVKNAFAVDDLHKLLCDYYLERPYEAIEVVSRAAGESDDYKDSTRANILEYLGDLEMRTDKLGEAEKHYREAENMYRRIHDEQGLANVLKSMGDLERRRAKLEEAEKHYREAENMYRRIHYDQGLANMLKSMGDLEMRTDKLEEAEKHYREAESVYRRIHNALGLANVFKSMGDLEMRIDKLEEAGEHYREAESVYRRIHDDLGLANVLQMMGDLEMRTDKLEEAREHYREAESVYRRIHNALGLANVFKSMGDLEMRIDKLEEAGEHYREAESVYRHIHDDLGLANVFKSMGDLEMCRAKLEEAEKHYREAESVYRRIRDDLGLANLLHAMGSLEQRKNSFGQAIVLYEDAFNLYKKTMGNMGLAYTSAELCYCYVYEGNREKAFKYARLAEDICENLPYENVKKYCMWKIELAVIDGATSKGKYRYLGKTSGKRASEILVKTFEALDARKEFEISEEIQVLELNNSDTVHIGRITREYSDGKKSDTEKQINL